MSRLKTCVGAIALLPLILVVGACSDGDGSKESAASGSGGVTLGATSTNPADATGDEATEDGDASTGNDGDASTGSDGGTSTGSDGGTSTGNDGGTSTGNDGGTSTGNDGGTSTGNDGGTSTGSDGGTSTGSDGGTSTGSDDGDLPPLSGGCSGYATRFWDCCKPHCGWEANVPADTTPVRTCNAANESHGTNWSVSNACEQPNANAGYTCFDMEPWAVSDTLAYGFAAVPADGDICGRCYQLEFSGTGHSNPDDPGSNALDGKTMIVQATNIGFDVGGGQFDIMIPGGGVGAFDACSSQWNVPTSELGATYGGFLTHCQDNFGDDWAQLKQCVLGRCAAVFDEPGHADLVAGCEWFVGWYETADNPNLLYQEVACPQALIDVSGIERPFDDFEDCGGGDCTQEQMDMCDCSWTNGGQNCGGDDGSCCWEACCG